MKKKIFVTRKISDLAEEKLKNQFDTKFNLNDQQISTKELVKLAFGLF